MSTSFLRSGFLPLISLSPSPLLTNKVSQTCVCFYGKYGSQCQDTQPYNCIFTLLSPNLACGKDPAVVLDPNFYSDNSCIKFSISGTISLIYNMTCSFENAALNFTTFVNDNNFVSSQHLHLWPTFADPFLSSP